MRVRLPRLRVRVHRAARHQPLPKPIQRALRYSDHGCFRRGHQLGLRRPGHALCRITASGYSSLCSLVGIGRASCARGESVTARTVGAARLLCLFASPPRSRRASWHLHRFPDAMRVVDFHAAELAKTQETQTPMNPESPNKTDAGNGSKAICRVSNVLRSPSPDPKR